MFYYISNIDTKELLENLIAEELPPDVLGRCKLLHTIISGMKVDKHIINIIKNSSNNIEVNLCLSEEELLKKGETIINWPGYKQAMLLYDL